MEDVDIAVVPVRAGALQQQGIDIRFFLDDAHVAPLVRCAELGLSEGDGVYVLGFPMGLVGRHRNYVIVREGAIARFRDALAGTAREFLLDASVFPGNSGGPVVIRPEITAIEGTKSVKAALLIGIVTGYVPYQDVAVSAQTGRPRVTFEENSGLAAAHPIDFVAEAITKAFPQPPHVEAAPPESPMP